MEKTKTTFVRFTDRYVRELPLAQPGGRYIERDAEQPGFFVLVGEKTRTYYCQFDVKDALGKRKTCRKALGRADQITATEARRAAKLAIAQRLQPEERVDVTLEQAWVEYKAYLEREGRSPCTIKGSQDAIERLLGDWLDVPLRRLAEQPGLVEDRYDKLLREKGTASAKNAMACLRAVYNKAVKRHPELRGLGNPVSTFKLKTPKARTDKALSPEELPVWYEQLRSLPNPIRQEYHLFMLLSGCRKTALAEARWEHVNLKRRALHIPKPKGGTARAYDIPLSREMLRCLWRVKRVGQKLCPGSPWIFPSTDHRPRARAASGHIEVAQEKSGLATGHALRYTYRSLAHAAGANPYDADMLMNHKVPGMAGTYLSPAAAWSRLLEVQEHISAFIWQALKTAREEALRT